VNPVAQKQVGLGEAKTGPVTEKAKSSSGRPAKSVLQPKHRKMLSEEEVKQLEGLMKKCNAKELI